MRGTLNLKLGLIVLAVGISLASLLYTHSLVQRLRARESTGMSIWAGAREEVARAATSNPYVSEYALLAEGLDEDDADTPRLQQALAWAGQLPMGEHIDFFFQVLSEYYPDVPAVITDSSGAPLSWRNLSVPDTVELTRRDSLDVLSSVARMARTYDPIPIKVSYGGEAGSLNQRVYYGESNLIRELRVFPYVQLLFVALFIVVGYLGFSHVRRNEQSSLWVGMAREAAHQLGTPISSLMGWAEVMRQDSNTDRDFLNEVNRDIERLSRVAHRFNDIGSMPKLKPQPVAPVIEQTADYIRARMPGRGVELSVDVAAAIEAPINAELFGWVIENLLKNALDAADKVPGQISVVARQEPKALWIDVKDRGRGIDRRHWRDIFRPGYTTRKRGWGLGLSLAKRITEDYHGGTLTLVESTLGKGTVFRITLPQP